MSTKQLLLSVPVLLLAPINGIQIVAASGYDFNDCAVPAGTAVNGVAKVADDGTGTNCVLHLTDANQCGVGGGFVIPDQAPGTNVDHIHVHWRSRVGGDDGSVCTATQFGRPGADGYSFNWGTDLSTAGGGEGGTGSGVNVSGGNFYNRGGGAPGLGSKYKSKSGGFVKIKTHKSNTKEFLCK